MLMNFYEELISIGLAISGCDSSGNVHISSRPTCPEGEELTWMDPTDNLVALVLAAHEKALSSDECGALQAAISEDAWLAYQDARKQPIRNMRAERYKNECDAMFLKCFEEATLVEDGDYYNCKVAKANFDGWKAAKEIVRSELPYPT